MPALTPALLPALLAAAIACALCAAAAAALVHRCLGELRRLRRELAATRQELVIELRGARQELAATREGASAAADRVVHAFLEADDAFKQMIDALRDVENMGAIRERVDQIARSLLDAHHKMGAQVVSSGQIVERLHELVVLWSAEGSALQGAYQTLARMVEEAIVREASTRERLTLQLETLLQAEARERGRHAA